MTPHFFLHIQPHANLIHLNNRKINFSIIIILFPYRIMYNNVTIIAKSIGILSGCSKQYNGASVNTFIIYIF
jgi:hypothetical protein